MTILEQILAAVRTRLDGIAGVTVYRLRTAALRVEDMPAVVMFMADQVDLDVEAGVKGYELSIPLWCAAVAADDDALGPALSALYGEVVDALLKPDPGEDIPTLGLPEMVNDVREGDCSGGGPGNEHGRPWGHFLLEIIVEYARDERDSTLTA